MGQVHLFRALIGEHVGGGRPSQPCVGPEGSPQPGHGEGEAFLASEGAGVGGGFVEHVLGLASTTTVSGTEFRERSTTAQRQATSRGHKTSA